LWHRQQAGRGDSYGIRFHQKQLVVLLGNKIKSNPSVLEFYEERAKFLILLDRLDEALADFSKLIELDSLSAHRYTDRAGLLRKIGDTNKALSDFKAALELDPENLDLRRRRGKYYGEIGRLDLAVDDLRQAFDIDGETIPEGMDWTNIRDVYQLAFLALLTGDRETYEASCRRVLLLLKAVPNSEQVALRWNALYFAAWTCVLANPVGLGELDWEFLKESLEFLRNGSDRRITTNARLLLAEIRALTGDLRTAEAELKEIELPPYNQLFLAGVLARLGQTEKANSYLSLGRKSIQTLRELQVDRVGSSKILGPWWPGDAEVADLLAAKVEKILP
ncbi:MAG: hypothetical protein JSW39_15845, partial [Desulfobacterales bacterium]